MIIFDRKIKKKDLYQSSKLRAETPTKKLLSRRWWSWAIIIFLVIGWFTALTSEADQHDKEYNARVHQTTRKSNRRKTTTNKKPKKKVDKSTKKESKSSKRSMSVSNSKKDNVPREYKNALLTLIDYQNSFGDMSYKGLYDQLTSDAGEGFTSEAANYALCHVKIDYNKNALKCAKDYEKTEHLSTAELREQLISDAGEKFTPEQAQYAIQHLDK